MGLIFNNNRVHRKSVFIPGGLALSGLALHLLVTGVLSGQETREHPRLDLAEKYYFSGDFERSQYHLTISERDEKSLLSNNAKYYKLKGFMAFSQGEFYRGEDFLQMSLKTKKDGGLLYLLGTRRLQAWDIEGAREYFEEYIKLGLEKPEELIGEKIQVKWLPLSCQRRENQLFTGKNWWLAFQNPENIQSFRESGIRITLLPVVGYLYYVLSPPDEKKKSRELYQKSQELWLNTLKSSPLNNLILNPDSSKSYEECIASLNAKSHSYSSDTVLLLRIRMQHMGDLQSTFRAGNEFLKMDRPVYALHAYRKSLQLAGFPEVFYEEGSRDWFIIIQILHELGSTYRQLNRPRDTRIIEELAGILRTCMIEYTCDDPEVLRQKLLNAARLDRQNREGLVLLCSQNKDETSKRVAHYKSLLKQRDEEWNVREALMLWKNYQ